MTSRVLIQKAITSYLEGKRPPSFRNSQYWFVLGPHGEALPAKAIWALTTGITGAKFNTTHAVAGLSSAGYSVIDIRHSQFAANFDDDVNKSLATSSNARKKRLASAPKMPVKKLALVEQFVRNPDVVAEVLFQANGVCQKCGAKAPFNRKSDETPYLEVHHKILLASGGEDTVANAIAMCPNCHRKAHYG
jgi:5-methylcytosine-specific restriction protein A